MGQADSLICLIGDSGIMVMCPSVSGLIPRTGPIDIIPGDGPIIGIMEGPSMGGVGIIPNEEDPGDWVELGSFPLQEEEQRVEREASFLTEMQPLFCQSGFGPALTSISDGRLSHSLCVS